MEIGEVALRCPYCKSEIECILKITYPKVITKQIIVLELDTVEAIQELEEVGEPLICNENEDEYYKCPLCEFTTTFYNKFIETE